MGLNGVHEFVIPKSKAGHTTSDGRALLFKWRLRFIVASQRSAFEHVCAFITATCTIEPIRTAPERKLGLNPRVCAHLKFKKKNIKLKKKHFHNQQVNACIAPSTARQ